MKRFVRLTGIFLIAAMLCGTLTGCKAFDYRKAQKLCDKGEYLEASALFSSLEDYKDSAEQANEAYRLYGVQLSESGNYEASILVLETLVDTYAPAQETLNDVRIAYGEDLAKTRTTKKQRKFSRPAK